MRRPTRTTRCPYTTTYQSHQGQRRRLLHKPAQAFQPRIGLAAADEVAQAADDLPGPPRLLRREVHRLPQLRDRKSTRLNSSHANTSYAVFCLLKKRALAIQ